MPKEFNPKSTTLAPPVVVVLTHKDVLLEVRFKRSMFGNPNFRFKIPSLVLGPCRNVAKISDIH